MLNLAGSIKTEVLKNIQSQKEKPTLQTDLIFRWYSQRPCDDRTIQRVERPGNSFDGFLVLGIINSNGFPLFGSSTVCWKVALGFCWTILVYRVGVYQVKTRKSEQCVSLVVLQLHCWYSNHILAYILHALRGLIPRIERLQLSNGSSGSRIEKHFIYIQYNIISKIYPIRNTDTSILILLCIPTHWQMDSIVVCMLVWPFQQATRVH